MKTETITTIKLIASEGMTLTDGEDFGKVIYIGTGDSADNWHEITDTEAESLQNDSEEI